MNKKTQKYINMLILIGTYLIVYPFVLYTTDENVVYTISFFRFYSINIANFGTYTLIGVVIFGIAVYLDFRKRDG